MPEFLGGNAETYFQLVFYAIGLFVVVAAGAILILVVRRSVKSSRLDTIAKMDLTRKSSLLTDEERAKIRQAQARLIHHIQLDEEKRKRRPSPATLLADPDVIALSDRVRAATSKPEQRTNDASPGLGVTDLSPGIPAQNTPRDTELPADVLKLAELGLISAEEIEAIRSRIRDRNHSGTE